jgi:hypothetical protein
MMLVYGHHVFDFLIPTKEYRPSSCRPVIYRVNFIRKYNMSEAIKTKRLLSALIMYKLDIIQPSYPDICEVHANGLVKNEVQR